MEGLMRRASGIYVARLVVPERFRRVLGRTELVATTGTRSLAVARIVAGHLLTQWRQRFHELDNARLGMDIEQLVAGSPELLTGGYGSLSLATKYSGLSTEELLKHAVDGGLDLFVRLAASRGHDIRKRSIVHALAFAAVAR